MTDFLPATMQCKLLYEDSKPPFKKNDTDAGFDLHAHRFTEDNLEEPKYRTLYQTEIIKIYTGIAVAIPEGHVGLIFDRSSLGAKGIRTLAGVIDYGYTGEVIVCLTYLENMHGPTYIKLNRGDRIAQLVVLELPKINIDLVDNLGDYTRGESGFGSTGK